ncbi:MAG: hypothetical protein ACU0CA_03365 [Paracoccaceae bacterium]
MYLKSLIIFTGIGLGIAGFASAQSANSFAAEDQTASGKFTTATEVKMILDATKDDWIGVRNWNGNDLLYFSNLLAWRCGTHEISYSVNGAEMQVLAMEPCYIDEPAPNALKLDGDIQLYLVFEENSIETIEVHVLYDDLSEVTVPYERAAVQMN